MQGTWTPMEKPDAKRCVEILDAVLAGRHAKGAVLKVYLENFKLINDTFGHKHGDGLLHMIADYFNKIEGVSVLWFRSLEFFLLMEGCGHYDAMDCARAICARFEGIWKLEGVSYMCSASVGAVLYPERAGTTNELLEALGQAVNHSEQLGPCRAVMFDAELQKKVIRWQVIARQMQAFHTSPQMLSIRYRPTYHMKEGRFTQAECCPQLICPEYGPVKAEEFFTIGEDAGMICPIGERLLREVCSKIKSLTSKNIDFETLLLPLSPVQLLQEGFLEMLAGCLEEFGVPEGKLSVELSDTVFLSAFSATNIVLQEVAQLGVRVVLSDFGTGATSILNVMDLPLDAVKLDRMLLWRLETDSSSQCVVSGLIQIASGLNLPLIADGVETEHQLQHLTEFGCPYAQGYLFSHTVAAEEIDGLLGEPLFLRITAQE